MFIRSFSRLLFFGFLAFTLIAGQPLIAVTGAGAGEPVTVSTTPSLVEFSQTVLNGTDQLAGVYVENSFAFPVVQQPGGSPGFVSSIDDQVTQFKMAESFGVTGLLAHNTHAGADFFSLQKGQTITLIYGNGQTVAYQITAIEHYRATSPSNPYSSFVSLDEENLSFTAAGLFKRIYQNSGQLVLQTCIKNNGIASWGRLFILAQPLDRLLDRSTGSGTELAREIGDSPSMR